MLFQNDPRSKLHIPDLTNLHEESFRISIFIPTFTHSFIVINQTILRIQVPLNSRKAQHQIGVFHLDGSPGFVFLV